jgi:ribosome maturation factor RimP
MPIFWLLGWDTRLMMKDRLHALIEPVVASLGCELWGIDFAAHGKSSLLRIYIDSEEGVSIGDCERVSRQVSSVLDVEDPVQGRYTLEVSSPGLNRRLFDVSQYPAYFGANVKIELHLPFEGRRKFSGLLCGIENDEVIVRVDEEEYLLPIDEIERANIVPNGR